jgi:hypothetical protein
MPPRFRTSILFAFVLLFLYLVFPFGRNDAVYDNGNQVVDLLKDSGGIHHDERPPPVAFTKEKPESSSTVLVKPAKPTSSTSSVEAASTSATQQVASTSTSSAVAETSSSVIDNGLKPQEQFNKEYDALGLYVKFPFRVGHLLIMTIVRRNLVKYMAIVSKI